MQKEFSLREQIWHGPGLSVHDRQKRCQLNTHTPPAQTIKITWIQFWYTCKCASSRDFSSFMWSLIKDKMKQKKKKKKKKPSYPKQAKTELKNRPVAVISPKPGGKYLFLKVLFPVVHITFPITKMNISICFVQYWRAHSLSVEIPPKNKLKTIRKKTKKNEVISETQLVYSWSKSSLLGSFPHGLKSITHPKARLHRLYTLRHTRKLEMNKEIWNSAPLHLFRQVYFESTFS